jgi:hypothetical protein
MNDRLALLVGETALSNYDFDTAEAALRHLSRSDATRDAAVRIAVSKYFAIKYHGLVLDEK